MPKNHIKEAPDATKRPGPQIALSNKGTTLPFGYKTADLF